MPGCAGLVYQINSMTGGWRILTVSLIALRRYLHRFPRPERAGRRLLFAAALLCCGCFAPAAAEAGAGLTIGATGGEFGTKGPRGDAFHQANPTIPVTVLLNLGSTGGINVTLAGAAGIGTSSRHWSGPERDRGAQVTEYGWAPLAFAIGLTTPVTTITTAPLAGASATAASQLPRDGKIGPVGGTRAAAIAAPDVPA